MNFKNQHLRILGGKKKVDILFVCFVCVHVCVHFIIFDDGVFSQLRSSWNRQLQQKPFPPPSPGTTLPAPLPPLTQACTHSGGNHQSDFCEVCVSACCPVTQTLLGGLKYTIGHSWSGLYLRLLGTEGRAQGQHPGHKHCRGCHLIFQAHTNRGIQFSAPPKFLFSSLFLFFISDFKHAHTHTHAQDFCISLFFSTSVLVSELLHTVRFLLHFSHFIPHYFFACQSLHSLLLLFWFHDIFCILESVHSWCFFLFHIHKCSPFLFATSQFIPRCFSHLTSRTNTDSPLYLHSIVPAFSSFFRIPCLMQTHIFTLLYFSALLLPTPNSPTSSLSVYSFFPYFF